MWRDGTPLPGTDKHPGPPRDGDMRWLTTALRHLVGVGWGRGFDDGKATAWVPIDPRNTMGINHFPDRAPVIEGRWRRNRLAPIAMTRA
jgi:hypothetical protein